MTKTIKSLSVCILLLNLILKRRCKLQKYFSWNSKELTTRFILDDIFTGADQEAKAKLLRKELTATLHKEAQSNCNIFRQRDAETSDRKKNKQRLPLHANHC